MSSKWLYRVFVVVTIAGLVLLVMAAILAVIMAAHMTAAGRIAACGGILTAVGLIVGFFGVMLYADF